MRVSEWIGVGYLVYLLALLAVRPPGRRRQSVLLFGGTVLIVLPFVVGRLPASRALDVVRPWLPLAYALFLYWLSGLFFREPQEAMEARFIAFDRRVRERLGATGLARTSPRVVLELLEAAYFSGYLMPPAGMIVLVLCGRVDLADRFWSTVLLAILGCYGALPWIRTRPWWVLSPHNDIDDRRLVARAVNLFFVHNTSTRANTFPSGHVAGALATALAVAPVSRVAGAVFFVEAAAVAAGSVVGEYHYSGDALAGAAVALAAWGVIGLLGV